MGFDAICQQANHIKRASVGTRQHPLALQCQRSAFVLFCFFLFLSRQRTGGKQFVGIDQDHDQRLKNLLAFLGNAEIGKN